MDHSRLAKLFIFILTHFLIATRCSSQKANQLQQYFRVKPQDVNAIEKETIQLNCEVGNLGGLVQWSKDGFLLSTSGYESSIPGFPRYSMTRDLARGSFNLQIHHVTLDDEGTFQCQVGPSENNQPIRAGAIVSISLPPQELLISSSSSICLPFNKDLNTELNDPSLILNSLNISQFASSFNSTTQYSNFVQLLNQLMKNNDQVNKLTKKLSKYRSSLPFIQLRETERLTLICNTSTGTKPETKLIWLKNGVPLKEDQYSTYIKSGLGNSGRLSSTKSSISIFIKATEEGSIYTCVALHPAQNEPKLMLSVQITVLMPPGMPKIEGYKEDEQITAGDSLTLACLCKAGNPPAKLKWLHDDQILFSNSQTIVKQQKKQPKSNLKDNLDNELIDPSDDFWMDLGEEETIEFSKLFSNRQSDVSRTLSIQVKPEDHFTTYSCQAVNQLMSTHHFRPNVASVRLNVQYPPSTIQLVGDRNALISQPNQLLKFSCAVGPSNPAAQVKLTIDDKPLEVIFKQNEMHYSIDHNSIRTSNSLNLENLLSTFDRLNRKLNGYINVGNSSISLNKIFNDKQKNFMQSRKQIKVACTSTHPLLTNTLISEYDLQLLYPPSPPTLKVEPSNPQIAGQYKRFTCTAKDGNPLAKLKFYKQREGKFNRIALQSSTVLSTTNQNSISTLDLLLTPNENGATIICEIDQHPALSTPSFVSKQIEVYFINEQLNLTTESSFKSARQPNNNDEWKLNDEFNLVCRAACNPECILDWYFNNNKLSSGTKHFRIQNEQSVSNNGGVVTISRLNINSLQISDHGNRIECVQSNALFNQTTKRDYTVNVLHSPVFEPRNNPKHFDIWENETMQFEFTAKGYPNSINYEFYFGSIKLTNSNHFQIHGSRILFKQVTLSLGGQYTVQAINSQGKTSHHFMINVLYSPKLISTTSLLYLDRNQTAKINCTVSSNPINQLRNEWQKLNIFEKFMNQNDLPDDEKLESNDVMYSMAENMETENDENELLKERLAYSYFWYSPNLDWWSSLNNVQQQRTVSYNTDKNGFGDVNGLLQPEYKPFIALNSSIYYNQKVISKNNELLIIANDTKQSQQQQYHLATATLITEPFLNDTDYLCLIHFNPRRTETSRTPSTNKQLPVVLTSRIAVRQKRPPLILDSNSLEIPVLLNSIKEQVIDYYWHRSQEQVNQNKKTINISNGSNRKSISVAAEVGDSVSFYCTTIRGALMLQFTWRDVKHGQLIGAHSHTFVQPSIESNWRRNLNSSFNDNTVQQPTINKNEFNVNANYSVRLHFNPKLPELITAELRLSKVNLEHFFTQFQCLSSNELGSDSRIYEIRRKSVPDQVDKVHIRTLNNNRLVLAWKPGFDGGFNQQFIVRFALKNELERAIQSKRLQTNTHITADLQHPNSVHSHESSNEIKRTKTAGDENDVQTIEQDDDQENDKLSKQNMKEGIEKSSNENSIQWRTEQNAAATKYAHRHNNFSNKKKKNLKKRLNIIKWNNYLLSPTGPLAKFGNERLVLNETQVEFTDLKPFTEYYFTVISKNRLGLAREHSIPLLIRTPKVEINDNGSDQVKSNLQLGENSLGLIENGFLINSSTKNLTIWLGTLGACVIVIVNVAIFSAYYCRQKAAKKLDCRLTLADASGSTSTNSTQSTGLSSNLNTPQQQTKNLSTTAKNHQSELSECDDNQIDSNENQKKISNQNNELLLNDGFNLKKKDDCLVDDGNDSLFKNNVTFTLMTNPLVTSNYLASATNTLTKSNQIDYLKNKQQHSTASLTGLSNQSLVYAQLRSDNSVANSLINSNDSVQSKSIVSNTDPNRYCSYATLNPLIPQMDNYEKSGLKNEAVLQTRINKLSADYKDKYIPYYLNENLLSNFEADLNCDGWNNLNNLNNLNSFSNLSNINSTLTDFYAANNNKLVSSNGLLVSSCTPSPSTITYSSQLPHLITSSSLATTNTLSPLDHLTPSTYSYQTTTSTSNQLDDSQIKFSNDYDQFISPTFTNQQSPLLVQTLTKNHSSTHFLTGDYNYQLTPDNLQSYSLQNNYKQCNKKSSKSHCKAVSFQTDQTNYYK